MFSRRNSQILSELANYEIFFRCSFTRYPIRVLLAVK